MAIRHIRARLERSLVASIRRTQREATIVFTDIEGSTRYWSTQGDIRGRLAVDRHNRLVIPIIHRCGGKVVKTIGDSVMALFRRPEDAVRAAAGVQQALAREREVNADFRLHVRIGVHTGRAIVERGDAYGNAVNAAARLLSCARGSEILLSGATVRRLGRGAKRHYAIERRDRVTPRGQNRPMTLYRVDWTSWEDVLDGREAGTLVTPEEKWQLAGYALGTAAGLWYVYAGYLRYALIDRDVVAVLVLDPLRITSHPLAGSLLALLAAGLAFGLWRMRRKPHRLLRLLRGTTGFSAVFVAVHLALSNWPAAWSPPRYWSEALHESEHLFVDVRQDRADIHAEPSRDAEILRQVRQGTLLLLADVRRTADVTWNRVLVGPAEYGWIARVLPAQMGVPETRVSLARKFYLHWYDLYAFGLGLLGLLWGLLNFRLRPA